MRKKKYKQIDYTKSFSSDENFPTASSNNSSEQLSNDEARMIYNTKRKGVNRSKLAPYDQSDMAEAKRYAKKNKFKVIFVAFIIFLLLAIIGTIITVLIIKLNNGPSRADYEICIGDEKPYTIKYKDANTSGEFYFDLRSIAKYSELTVSGSDGRIKFTCADGTYVRFTHNSTTATVNGDAVKVGGKVQLIDSTEDESGKCLVPFKFIQKLFSYKADGVSVGMVAKISNKNKVTIHRISYSNGTQPPISFASECFDYADDMLLQSYPNSDIDGKTAAALCVEKLKLVNPSHPLTESQISTNGLVSLKSLGCPVATGLEDYDNKDFFDPIAALALIAMINEANKTLEGDDKILVSSAYRSYSYQEGLHEDHINTYMGLHDVSEEEAREQVRLTSAQAGMSEHHTGLCVDFVEKRGMLRELDETFAETEAYAWLSQNAHKYGFILRYPDGKTDITQYSYEPWHYRFVGVYAATIIYEDAITLEEYLADFN